MQTPVNNVYEELYSARVVLNDSKRVEQHTVYTNDRIHGRVGNHYNTRLPVCFLPDLNIWHEEGMTRDQINGITNK